LILARFCQTAAPGPFSSVIQSCLHIVTTCGHNGNVKKEVRIADLKAHLSEHVRAAQKGEEILIKDRETPVAMLVPVSGSQSPLQIIPAKRPGRGTQQMRSVQLHGLKPGDVAKALASVREERVDRWLNLKELISTRR
jgi:prevent-host-death family protein